MAFRGQVALITHVLLGLVAISMVEPIRAAPSVAAKESDSSETKVSEATTQFGLNFIKNLPENSENVIFSPLSLQNLLNMILLGAKDNSKTQHELAKVLNYDSVSLLADTTGAPANRLKPHEAMLRVAENIMETIKNFSSPGNLMTRPVEFTLANMVLTNKDIISLKDEYKSDLKYFYNVELEQFSDLSSAEKASDLVNRINSWVRNKTQNQIQNLASENDLSSDLIMVLLNAAHFKGHWLRTFNPSATSEKTFYNLGSEKDTSQVKFMRQKSVFSYARFSSGQHEVDIMSSSGVGSDDESPRPKARKAELISKLNCSVLALPFSLNKGQELSMVILLPAKRDGVVKLQAALDASTLSEIYSSLDEQKVEVELPKFSFEASHDAGKVLRMMGLQSVFGEAANLDRMYNVAHNRGDIRAGVDKVIHKAKITVDETGAEAAAASMATIGRSLSLFERPVPTFKADHPFLFIIRHNKSNMPLFMGRVDKF